MFSIDYNGTFQKKFEPSVNSKILQCIWSIFDFEIMVFAFGV